MGRLKKLDKIVAAMHPHLAGDKKALAVRLATAEEMVRDGWVFEHNGEVAVLTTPMLRFGYSPYFAQSRYKLTPNPHCSLFKNRERWKVESIDHPEWERPHPHIYRGIGGFGLCCGQVQYGKMQKEPLWEAMAMAATMSGKVLEGSEVTNMKPFADKKLSSAAPCPYCQMDVDKKTTNCQKNGYFYHKGCWKAMSEEVSKEVASG